MAKLNFGKAANQADADRLGRKILQELEGAGSLTHISNYIAEGANLEVTTAEGATPLIVAASKGFTDAGVLLLDNKANPNAVTRQGVTALIYTAVIGSSGDPVLAKKLVEKGAKDNVFYRTKTALMWAAHRGFRDVAREIAQNGDGDILQKSTGDNPMNAIEWAEDNNKKGMADELRRILKFKQEVAETKLRQEKAREREAAERLEQQRLDEAITKGVLNHKPLIAPERATFKKKPIDHKPQ